MSTSNRELAAALRQSADAHPGASLPRRAHLVAAVALHEARTLAGAQKLLARERLDAQVRDAAQTILDQLTETT